MTSAQKPELTIRPAKPADAGTLLSLIRELAEYEKLSHEVVATEADLKHSLFENSRGAEAVIGEVQGKPVAFALFFHNYSTFLAKPGIYLEDLFVLPAFRGQGFGQKLFAWLAALANERDCGRLDWSVLDWNTPAIRFYERLGAKGLSDWTTYRLDGDTLRCFSDL